MTPAPNGQLKTSVGLPVCQRAKSGHNCLPAVPVSYWVHFRSIRKICIITISKISKHHAKTAARLRESSPTANLILSNSAETRSRHIILHGCRFNIWHLSLTNLSIRYLMATAQWFRWKCNINNMRKIWRPPRHIHRHYAVDAMRSWFLHCLNLQPLVPPAHGMGRCMLHRIKKQFIASIN